MGAVFQIKAPSSQEIVIQTIAYDTTTVATNAFSAQTRQVRLTATSACVYKIGQGAQTAVDDNTGCYLPANVDRIISVTPGQSIAALKKATNGLVTGTAGTLWVVELG